MKILTGFLGGFISILILLLLTHYTTYPLIMAPFGATCVLLYAAAQSPLAQPKNVILGHFISALIGLVILHTLGSSLLSIAFAVGLTIAAMQFLDCIHPPAGANPLVILLSPIPLHFDFLLFPVLLGAVVLVIISKINLISAYQRLTLR